MIRICYFVLDPFFISDLCRVQRLDLFNPLHQLSENNMADISKEDLKKEIQEILKDADLDNTSAKKVN